jgi:hypothetical protein
MGVHMPLDQAGGALPVFRHDEVGNDLVEDAERPSRHGRVHSPRRQICEVRHSAVLRRPAGSRSRDGKTAVAHPLRIVIEDGTWTMKKKLRTLRENAMQTQGGLCFYCRQPMWSDRAETHVQRFGLPPRKAEWFQCTAEHLLARCEGGGDQAGNIVAACRFCNWTRHRARRPLEPIRYAARVRSRMATGGWLRLQA